MYRMVMSARTLRWRDLAPLRAGLHLARSVYAPHARSAGHGHDFAEICWVERGRVLHEDDGGRRILERGDAVLIEPGHCHALGGAGGGGVLVNIAFPARRLDDLRTRWGDALWPASPRPTARCLDDPALADLARRCNDLLLLPPGGGDPLNADLLLGLALDHLRPPPTRAWPDLPDWLAEALEALAQPPLLAEGLAALPRLTGRSREHISRAIRQGCGRSATAMLQDLRLGWAERRLLASEDSVAAIGRACGFDGRAHFHRLFAARFGQPPGAYRRRARRTLGA